MMSFCYRYLIYILYPFIPVYFFFRKLKKKEHSERYRERLSKIKLDRGKGFLIWFHVASVGELISIFPLIEFFEKDKKINKILISSITLSSSEIIEKKYRQSAKIVHQFAPLDFPNFVNKFLDHWSPNLSIFIDSEIWPNLISKIKKKNIPLILVNGRITKKSFNRWNFVKGFAQKIFQKFDLCLASNNETQKYLNVLGVKNIKNYGNLKFAKTKKEFDKKLDNISLNKIKNKMIWCAASTHQSEEMFCAQVHLNVKKKLENILTIIIPRHIDRTKQIVNELSSLNLKICLYSRFDEIEKDTDILLIDVYGEASKFYNISKIVFLGKSLIKSLAKDGGQNPIEPSRLGCKILHGPYVSNFAEIYEYLHSLKAATQISTEAELNQSLVEELNKDKIIEEKIIQKIENYGQNTFNNVINELKKYIY